MYTRRYTMKELWPLMQVTRSEGAYPQFHLLQGREAHSRGVSYVWPVVFSPPLFILWFWPVVLFYIIIIVEPHVFGTLVLVIYAIDPCF